MDVNSLIGNKKKTKLQEGEGSDESSIRICDLPDPILQLIISSLSTKEAVRTSVLSKRWVYLWRGVSKIELKEGAPEKRQQFIDFVRRFLEVCDCSDLKKFFLSCKVGEDAPKINEWLHGFINPKIQKLKLDLQGMKEPLVFPVHLFTCARLTKFQLRMNHIFKVPSFIHFERLRTLTLQDIIFSDSSSAQQLFSGCPSLKELALASKTDHTGVSDEDYDVGGLNVSNCCNVAIVGTNLKSFSYEGDLKNDYILYSSTSVIDSSIEVHGPIEYWLESDDWERHSGYLAFKLLEELPNVEKLSISKIALSAISNTTSLLLEDLPLFCNLTELSLLSGPPVELSCQAFLTILRKSPRLQVIDFWDGVYLPNDSSNNNYILDPLPMCFRENLKTIEIGFFAASFVDEELHAIKTLLQEASVLETLHINCSSHDLASPTRSQRLKKLYKQIVRFPRGSADCEIVFKY